MTDMTDVLYILILKQVICEKNLAVSDYFLDFKYMLYMNFQQGVKLRYFIQTIWQKYLFIITNYH
jgi:hypothetical protein